MIKKILLILAIFFILLGGFSFFNIERVDSVIVDDCPSLTKDYLIRNEYRCLPRGGSFCGAHVQKREYRSTQTCDCMGCGPISTYHTSPVNTSLESWQECNNRWRGVWVHRDAVEYSCQGRCLESIQNLKFNEKISPENVSLPAKITWNQVDGFRHRDKGPSYYFINIEDTNADPIDGIFSFEHFYETDNAQFPSGVSMPRFSAFVGTANDGQFIKEGRKYRFARPTPHRINRITSCYGQRWGRLHAGIDIGRQSSDGNHPVYNCIGGYGSKYGFANVCREFHSINAPPIYASAPGIIETMRYAGSAGNMVIINHSAFSFAGLSTSATPNSIKTRYLHLQSFSGGEHEGVRAGDRVTPEGTIRGTRRINTGRLDDEGRPIFENRDVQIRSDVIIGYMGSSGSSTGPHLHYDIIINGTRVDPLPLIAAPGGWLPSNLSCVRGLPPVAGFFDVLAVYANYQPKPNSLLYILTSDPHDEFHEGPSPDQPFVNSSPFTWKTIGNPFNVKIPVNNFMAGNCLLKPNRQHKGSIRACCDSEGNNCGPTRSFDIKTSNAPEALRTGVGEGTESNPEIVYNLEDANLRWCGTVFEEQLGTRIIELPPSRYEIQVQKKLPFLGLAFWQTYQCHPSLRKHDCVIKRHAISPDPPPTHVLNYEYLLFTKSNYAHYRWRVRACLGNDCPNWPNKWTYLAVSDDVVVPPPNLISPINDPDGRTPVGWPVDFRWGSVIGANSFIFEIFEGNSTTAILRKVIKVQDETGADPARIFTLTLPEFKIDTPYRWRVKSCWDDRGKENFCEKEWSEGKFRTTGRPPILISPLHAEANVLIPITLKWESVPGASSYVFTFSGEDVVVKNNEITLNHEKLVQGTNYYWSVSTCNDINGLECGPPSNGFFTTIKLTAPQNLSPETEFFTERHNIATIKWDKVLGANFYRLTVNCDNYDEIITATQADIPLKCIGDNFWTVKACIDPACNDSSQIASSSFTLTEGRRRGGLIPCGQRFNNPDTDKFGINEREPCQPRHLFVLLKRLIDLVLWELTPMALFLLMIWSAIVFYTSMGNINTITKIKSIWSAVGKGLIIMFFSWTLISFIVSVLGFRFGIYGQWFQI